MISPISPFLSVDIQAPSCRDPLAGSRNSPFSTPPSIEAALARDPAAPLEQAGASPAGSVDPSAVARFRQALALHEDLADEARALLQKDLAEVPEETPTTPAAEKLLTTISAFHGISTKLDSASPLTLPATPPSVASPLTAHPEQVGASPAGQIPPPSDPFRKAGFVPDAPASGPAISSPPALPSTSFPSFHDPVAEGPAIAPSMTRVSSTPRMSALPSMAPAPAAVPLPVQILQATAPAAPTPSAVPTEFAPSAAPLPGQVLQTAAPATPAPSAATTPATRESLAAAASAALSQSAAFADSTTALRSVSAPVREAASPETLAAAATTTIAQAATFEASAATLTTAAVPLLAADAAPVVPLPGQVLQTAAPAAPASSAAPTEFAPSSAPLPGQVLQPAASAAHTPSASPTPATRETLAAAASAALAQSAAFADSTTTLRSATAPVREAASPETLVAAATTTIAQATAFEASAATLATAAVPLLAAATAPVVETVAPTTAPPSSATTPVFPQAASSVPEAVASGSIITPAPSAAPAKAAPTVAPLPGQVLQTAAPAAPALSAASAPATRESLAAAASAALAQSAAFADSTATLRSATEPVREATSPETLAAAATATAAQAAVFEASAATLTTAAFPLLAAATTPADSAPDSVQSVPIATAAPAPNPVESVPTLAVPASIAPAPHTVESVPTPVVAAAPSFSSPHAMISPMPPSSPASAPEPTPETLAAAASATMAQAASFEASVAQFVSAGSQVPVAEPANLRANEPRPLPETPPATRETLAAEAFAALARAAVLDDSAVAFQSASSPIVSSPLPAPVEKPGSISAAPTPVSPTAAPVDAASKIPVSPTEANLMAPVAMFTATDGTTIPYRAYIPAPAQPESAQTTTPAVQFPLVLFMHGAGTRGSDGVAIADNISFRSLLGWVKNHEPAIVLAPQCPADEKWVDTPWGDVRHTYSPVPPPHTAAALELLDKALASLPVDRSRILVCGNSMGGYASWDLLVRRPGLFAAALPVCGGGVPDLTAETSRDVAIWAFHGDADPAVPVENTRSMVEALRADPDRTAEIRYREYPGVSHDSWTPTFTDPEVLSWFFAQHRAGPAAPAVTRETLAAEASAALLRATALSDSATAFAVTAQPVLAAASNDGQAVLGQPAPTSATPVPQAPAPEPAPALATSPTSADPVPTAPVPGSVPPSAPDAEDIAAAIQAAPLPASPQVDSSLVTRHSSLAEAVSPASIVRAAFEPAVEAVAEAIQVSSDLATRGEGEIRIQLKPAVLDGSTVQISVSGNDMSIVFTPATPDAAALLQAHTPELATLLAERVPAWHATVHVSKRNEHA